MATENDMKIVVIKKGALNTTSGKTSWIGNIQWESLLFSFEARFPVNTVPGPEHLSLVYMTSDSERREVRLRTCTPDCVYAVTEEERRQPHNAAIKKTKNVFAIQSEAAEQSARTLYLQALTSDDMTSWLCKLKEYLSKGELYAVVVEPNQGIQSGSILLTIRDSCLILLCGVTNKVLGVWQLKDLLSFGLRERSLWFIKNNPQKPKSLKLYEGLNLTDVEDCIYLTVDPRDTGPRILDTMKWEMANKLKRSVVEELGAGLEYTVKPERAGSQGSRAGDMYGPEQVEEKDAEVKQDTSEQQQVTEAAVSKPRKSSSTTSRDDYLPMGPGFTPHVTMPVPSHKVQNFDDELAEHAVSQSREEDSKPRKGSSATSKDHYLPMGPGLAPYVHTLAPSQRVQNCDHAVVEHGTSQSREEGSKPRKSSSTTSRDDYYLPMGPGFGPYVNKPMPSQKVQNSDSTVAQYATAPSRKGDSHGECNHDCVEMDAWQQKPGKRHDQDIELSYTEMG